MKKMLLVAIAGIAVLSSCNKSYNCVCTSVKPDGTVVDQTSNNISGTKDGATKDCAKLDNVNGTVTTTCLLN
jgi:outer membrane protein assembly factor BamE (lipoprotein component of BamABCDE complex)